MCFTWLSAPQALAIAHCGDGCGEAVLQREIHSVMVPAHERETEQLKILMGFVFRAKRLSRPFCNMHENLGDG